MGGERELRPPGPRGLPACPRQSQSSGIPPDTGVQKELFVALPRAEGGRCLGLRGRPRDALQQCFVYGRVQEAGIGVSVHEGVDL